MNKKRDSFIFYRSFYEAISDLPDKKQLKLFKAIAEYSLNFSEIDLIGLEKTIFKLIKPQISANNKRYQNGLKGREHGDKGGRPSEEKADKKKPQANPGGVNEKNPKLTPNVNENVECRMSNVNEKENEELFNIFYSLYPLKKSKIFARASFNKVMKDNKFEDILTGLEKYNRSIQDGKTEKQYIKHPSTWLNQGCWQDEYKEITTQKEPEVSYEL